MRVTVLAHTEDTCESHLALIEEKPFWLMCNKRALFNPETPILIQERHPYTGNLNSGTFGDSKNAFLHFGDVSGLSMLALSNGLTSIITA